MATALMIGIMPGIGLGLMSDPDDGANIGAGLVLVIGLFVGPAVGGGIIGRRATGLRRPILAALVSTPLALILVTAVFALRSYDDLDGNLGVALGGLIIGSLIWSPFIVGGAATGASIAGKRRPAESTADPVGRGHSSHEAP